MTITREQLDAGNVDFSDIEIEETITVTPGDVLVDRFLTPLKLSAKRLAKDIGVPTNRITGIIHGQRAITADTAVRLGWRFRVAPEFWMNLQTRHDLSIAKKAWTPERELEAA